MKGDLPRPGIWVLSRALLTSRPPQALGQASVPHSDLLSHLAPGPPRNFNQAFCPDDSQLPNSTPPLSLMIFVWFFFWPLQTVPPTGEGLSPNSWTTRGVPALEFPALFREVMKLLPARARPPAPPTRFPPPGVLCPRSSRGSLLPSFRAQPKCHLLREASPASLPHSHVTQVYYLQEHLFIYFAYCLFLPLLENPWRAGAGSCPFQCPESDTVPDHRRWLLSIC